MTGIGAGSWAPVRCFRWAGAIAVLIAAAVTSWAGPDTAAEVWRPPPPPADGFDWAQLVSGEWLKGEIVAMYDQELEFDSEELDLVRLDWEDVRELRSGGVMEVALTGGRVLWGRVLVTGEEVVFVGEAPRHFPRVSIVSISSGSQREIDNWDVRASLGANLRQGNSDQVEATAQAKLVRRTARNRTDLEYLASVNRSEDALLAESQRATLGWNRYLSRRLFLAPVFLEWYSDPFQNVDDRWTVGTGVGYSVVDSVRTTWEVAAGLGYLRTEFNDVAEPESTTADTPALMITTTYEHELTGWLDLHFEGRVTVVNRESGTYIHHLVSGLELELTDRLDLDLTLIWDRTRNPQEDASGVVPEPDDYRLVTSLGFEF